MRLFSMCMFVGAVSLCLTGAEPAAAQKGAKKAADEQLATQLVAIRVTLNMANHDYKGHRAAAVHQISHAIHLIRHGKAHPNPGEHFQAAKEGNNEPQNVSDKQLQSAMMALQGLGVPPTKHQAKVQGHIATAIVELQTALKVN